MGGRAAPGQEVGHDGGLGGRAARQWPRPLVLVAGQEATLWMRGILPGATIEKRMAGLVACGGVSQHADALNEFLGQARAAVYASHQPLPEHTR